METRGDGCGRSITSEHVALQHARVLVSRHVGKVPETRREGAEQLAKRELLMQVGKQT